MRAVVTSTRWGLFAGLAILVTVVIAATLWLDKPETAVGRPVEGVMVMVMLLGVISSLFMMLTIERLFRDMRTGAVPITSIAGGLQIIGGILFLATCLMGRRWVVGTGGGAGAYVSRTGRPGRPAYMASAA